MNRGVKFKFQTLLKSIHLKFILAILLHILTPIKYLNMIKSIQPKFQLQMLHRFVLLLAVSLICFIQNGTSQIYLHDFGVTTITSHPYTVSPGTLDANLSTSSWSNSTSAWTSFAGSAGQAIAMSNSGGTPTITLTFSVSPGFQCSVTSFNFWRQRSGTGAQNWAMTINGIAVGSGTVPTSGTAIGVTNVTNAVSNQTGTMTVVISLSGATGTGTFRLDDFTLNGTVTSVGGVNNPASFSATTASASQINLLSTANGNGNNIVVVTNASGTFSSPSNGTAAPAAGNPFVGGTVVYNGSAASLTNHTGLTGNTQYFYKAFSYDGSNNYSTGLTANATTYYAEPSQHASSFSCGTTTETTIPLSWTDAGGSVLPAAYLIKWSSVSYGSIIDPVDLSFEVDGPTSINVLQGAQAVVISSLVPTTTYYFKIYSYTNSGSIVDYKTDGSISQTSCATQSGPILAWQFGSPASVGSEVSYSATTIHSNLNTSTLTRGSGISATALGRAFSANSWRDASATKANAIADNEYFQYTVHSNSGYSVSLSSLDVRLRRSGTTSPNAYIWQYSKDGINFFDIGTDISFTSIADGVDQSTIDLSVISELQNVPATTTITFRLYAWGGTNAGSTFAIGRYGAGITTNSLAIGGSVNACANPTPYIVTGGGSYCAGGSGLTVGLSGSESGTSYQLQLGGVDTGSPILGNGNAFNFSNQTASGTYTVVATAPFGCTSSMSGNVSISIDPLPALFNVTGDGNYCVGTAGIFVNLSGSETTMTYQLMANTLPIGSSMVGSGTSMNFGPITTAGVYYVEAFNTSNPACTSAMTGTATITFNSLGSTFNVTGGGAYCFGGVGVSVGLSNSQTGFNYMLLLNGTDTISTLPGTNGTIDFGLQTLVGTYTIISINSENSDCFILMNGSAVVSILSLPTASISGDNTICIGGSSNLTLNFTGAGPWAYAINNGTPANTSNNPESVSVNPTSTTVYTITSLSDANCTGTTSGSATVNVTNAPPSSSCTITSLPLDACVGNTVVVSTNVVPGATSYTWSAPAGTLIDGFASPYTSATNSVNITLGNVPTNSSGWLICAFASNACGSTNTNCKPIRGTLSTPSAIAGSTVACPSTGPSNYSTTAVGGASSYLWTITGDASVTGTGITAAVTFGPTFTTGSLCVRALLPCGFQGAQRCLTIANGTPILGVMTGTFTVCPGTNGVAFSVPPSLGATTYNWTLPAGASIATGAGTNSITVDFGPSYTNGNVCVTAQSICGATSLPRCKTVASITPGTPGNFTTGATTGVCGQTITYNVNTVSGATGYTWTAPAGASLASANGTNTIDIAFGPGYTTGNVCVTARQCMRIRNTTLCEL